MQVNSSRLAWRIPIFAGISPASLASSLSPIPPEAGGDACTTKFGVALHHWDFPRRIPCRAMRNCGQKNTAACCQTAVYFSEMVYKPNSVPLVGRRSLIWDRRYRLPQATYPESTRIIRADSPKRTLPVMMLRLPLSLDGGILRRTPARRAGASIPYLVLHPVGFAMPAMSPWPRCALTAPFHPYHSEKSEFGGIFSVALSRIPVVANGNGWGLPTTAPCGVRTFLPAYAERPPDHSITPIVAD